MKYILLLSSLLIVASGSFAQQLPALQGIGTTGGFAIDTNGGVNFSVSYTVGEMAAVTTDTTPGGVPIQLGNGQTFNFLTQGFEQPVSFLTGLIDLETGDFGSFVIYPNPAVDYFSFGFQLPAPGKVSIELHDELGRLIESKYTMNYTGGQVVDRRYITAVAAGTYMVSLTFTGSSDGVVHVLSKKLVVVK